MDQKEITADIIEAGQLGIALFWKVALLALGGHMFLWWGEIASRSFTVQYFPFALLLLPVILALGIVLHELLHALVLVLFAPSRWKAVKFGVLRQYFTPYCHCREPVSLMVYRVCLLCPLIFLGFFPLGVGLWQGIIEFTALGIIFIPAAGGDLVIFKLLRGFSRKTLVLDHPRKPGIILWKEGKQKTTELKNNAEGE